MTLFRDKHSELNCLYMTQPHSRAARIKIIVFSFEVESKYNYFQYTVRKFARSSVMYKYITIPSAAPLSSSSSLATPRVDYFRGVKWVSSSSLRLALFARANISPCLSVYILYICVWLCTFSQKRVYIANKGQRERAHTLSHIRIYIYGQHDSKGSPCLLKGQRALSLSHFIPLFLHARSTGCHAYVAYYNYCMCACVFRSRLLLLMPRERFFVWGDGGARVR